MAGSTDKKRARGRSVVIRRLVTAHDGRAARRDGRGGAQQQRRPAARRLPPAPAGQQTDTPLRPALVGQAGKGKLWRDSACRVRGRVEWRARGLEQTSKALPGTKETRGGGPGGGGKRI